MAFQLARDALDALPLFACAHVCRGLALQFERAEPVTADEAHMLRDHMLPSIRALLDALLAETEPGPLANVMVKAYLARPTFS